MDAVTGRELAPKLHQKDTSFAQHSLYKQEFCLDLEVCLSTPIFSKPQIPNFPPEQRKLISLCGAWSCSPLPLWAYPPHSHSSAHQDRATCADGCKGRGEGTAACLSWECSALSIWPGRPLGISRDIACEWRPSIHSGARSQRKRRDAAEHNEHSIPFGNLPADASAWSTSVR